MEREKRITRIHITGIIQQVFDVYEKENKLPNTYEFYKAIFNWIEYEKCPNMEISKKSEFKENLINEKETDTSKSRSL